MKKIFAICMSLMLVLCGCCPKDSATQTETEPVLTPKINEDIPAEYRNIYADAIADYKKIVSFRLSSDFESAYNAGEFAELNSSLTTDITGVLGTNWQNMIVEMFDYIEAPSMESFGYVFCDLNHDEVPELIWVSSDYKTIFAIFTILEDAVKFVDCFWPRYQAVILDSGVIYTRGSGGANIVAYTLSVLTNTDEVCLRTITSFGVDGDVYYQTSATGRTEITKQEVDFIRSNIPFEFGKTWQNYYLHTIS